MLEEAGYFSEAADAYLQTVKRYNHPVAKPDTPMFIVHSHFLAGEMLYKVQNNESALAQFEKTIRLYENRQEPEIRERIQWAFYHSGNIYALQGQEEKALKIYKDLIDSPEGEGSLWKKMAIESYQSLARQMSYQNYLNQ
jgi:tetratricopeptide (TPR) repeat protein